MTATRLFCEGCGKALPPPIRRGGNPRKYHDERCRSQARARRAPTSWQSMNDELPELPVDPTTRKVRMIEGLVGMIEGEPEPAPMDRFAGILTELAAAVWHLRRVERELPPGPAAGAAAAIAGDIVEAVRLHTGIEI